MKTRRLLLVVLLLMPLCFAEMKDTVKTESGLVRGAAGRDQRIAAFKGVPDAFGIELR